LCRFLTTGPHSPRLITEIDTLPELADLTFSILAIDDGSTIRDLAPILAGRNARIRSIRVAKLACNLGHQRAIAIGLVQT
jgi:hypothetical protein